MGGTTGRLWGLSVLVAVACGGPDSSEPAEPNISSAPLSVSLPEQDGPAPDVGRAVAKPPEVPKLAHHLVPRPAPYFFVDGCMASAAETKPAALRECRRLATRGERYQRRHCKCAANRLVEVRPDDPIAFYRGCCWAAGETPAEARTECQRRIDQAWCEETDVEAVHVATGPYVRKGPFRKFEGEGHRYLVPSDSVYPDWVGSDGEPPCFPAGTPIELERGATPIEEVEVGDQVLTLVDDALAYAPVLGVHTRRAPEVFVLDLGDRTLRVTAEHPIWADGSWRAARQLRVGDRLRETDGDVMLKGVEADVGDVEVWSLRVGTPHSYFAGGVWGHNY